MGKAALCSICEKVIGGNGFPFDNLRSCCSWGCWLEHARRWCYVKGSKDHYPNPKYYDKRGQRLPGVGESPNGVY